MTAMDFQKAKTKYLQERSAQLTDDASATRQQWGIDYGMRECIYINREREKERERERERESHVSYRGKW